MNSPLIRVLLTATAAGLVSCSSVKSTMAKVGEPVASLAKAQGKRLKNLRLPGLDRRKSDIPPVVKIRRQDLREVQMGSQKVLAWTRSKELGGGTFYFPANFDPEVLPVGTDLPTAGILPPLPSGDRVGSPLPDDVANLPELSRSDFEGGDSE